MVVINIGNTDIELNSHNVYKTNDFLYSYYEKTSCVIKMKDKFSESEVCAYADNKDSAELVIFKDIYKKEFDILKIIDDMGQRWEDDFYSVEYQKYFNISIPNKDELLIHIQEIKEDEENKTSNIPLLEIENFIKDEVEAIQKFQEAMQVVKLSVDTDNKDIEKLLFDKKLKKLQEYLFKRILKYYKDCRIFSVKV